MVRTVHTLVGKYREKPILVDRIAGRVSAAPNQVVRPAPA
jgi:hypothetical protein